MNGKLYRCGWCGMPTESNGKPLEGKSNHKATGIVIRYGDYRTHKTNGWCCPESKTAIEEFNSLQYNWTL